MGFRGDGGRRGARTRGGRKGTLCRSYSIRGRRACTGGDQDTMCSRGRRATTAPGSQGLHERLKALNITIQPYDVLPLCH
jgi:hypothetical protein